MGIFNFVKSILGGSANNSNFEGYTDFHSHLLPGVDDGVQEVEDTLEILNIYERLGFRRIWLTPHIMEEVPNTPEHLKERFSELQQIYTGNIELKLAAENMIDELFIERLKNDDLLPLEADRRYLLVETSYYARPHRLLHIFEDIMSKGYTPLLAHPERYNYMKKEDYVTLKNMGVKFQLNLLSLTRHYGPFVRDKAKWIASQKYYNLSGSDTHRISHAEEIEDLRSHGDLIRLLSITN